MFEAQIRLHQVIDEAARRMDGVRVHLARGNDFLHLGDYGSGGGRDRMIEIVFGHPVLKIACRVGAPGAQEGDIARDGFDEHHLAAVDHAGFAAFRQQGVGGCGGEESAKAGAARAQSLGESSLRNQFGFDLAGLYCRDSLGVAGEERADGLAYLPIVDQAAAAESGFADVVADEDEILDLGFGKRVQQVNRRSGHAETADEQFVAGTDLGGGLPRVDDGDVLHSDSALDLSARPMI